MEAIRVHQFAEKLELAGYAKRTIEEYCGFARAFLAYLDERENVRDLRDLRLEHVRAYQAWLQFGRQNSGESALGRGAIANHLYALKTFLRLMAESALVRDDLSTQVNAPRQRKSVPRHVPDVAAMKRIIEAAVPANPLTIRDRCILELLYATGIRSEELRTLDVDDWDESANTLFVTGKGDKDRVVPVGSWVVPYLYAYRTKSRSLLCRKDTPLLFVSRNGLMLARANLAWVIRKYARLAGVAHVCVHTFRHACATHLLENGADIRYVQELLGHSDLSTTQVYTRVTIDFLKQAHGKYHPRERETDDAH